MVETSFFELRQKNVINVLDGKCLGKICDIVMEICNGQILGLVVPAYKGFWSIFRPSEEIFIPYNNICKIGEDVILVELSMTEVANFKTTSFSETAKLSKVQNVKNDTTATPNQK